MTKLELRKLIEAEEITITDVIDEVIDLNGIIGVGLISLADDLSDYIKAKIKKISQAVIEGA